MTVAAVALSSLEFETPALDSCVCSIINSDVGSAHGPPSSPPSLYSPLPCSTPLVCVESVCCSQQWVEGDQRYRGECTAPQSDRLLLLLHY